MQCVLSAAQNNWPREIPSKEWLEHRSCMCLFCIIIR